MEDNRFLGLLWLNCGTTKLLCSLSTMKMLFSKLGVKTVSCREALKVKGGKSWGWGWGWGWGWELFFSLKALLSKSLKSGKRSIWFCLWCLLLLLLLDWWWIGSSETDRLNLNWLMRSWTLDSSWFCRGGWLSRSGCS